MSRPEDKIPPMRQDVTRVDLGRSKSNIGWREVINQYLPEHLKLPSTEEAIKQEEVSKVRLMYGLTESEAIKFLEGGANLGGLPASEPSLLEKIIPEEIRRYFRPSTTAKESLAAKTLDVARFVSGVDEPYSVIDPTPISKVFAAGGPLFRRGIGEAVEAVSDVRGAATKIEDIVSEVRTGVNTVGIGYDPSLTKKLGQLYKEDLPGIVVKELIQNAVDATRRVSRAGKIKVNFSPVDRVVEIVDNGVGMSPDVMSNQFMDVAGTTKALEEGSSGKWGLAKVALFSQAEEISAVSVATVGGKKVQTTITGSADAWIAGKMSIEAHTVDKAIQTGTAIRIKLNEKVGSMDKWWGASSFARTFKESGKLKNIDVEFLRDSQPLIDLSSILKYSDEPITTIHLDNADIDVYNSERKSAYGYTEPRILNLGLYQFSGNAKRLGQEAPSSVLFDVKSKVDIESFDYPFTPSREELKANVQKAIDDYLANIGTAADRRQFIFLRNNVARPYRIERSGHSVYNIDKANSPDLFEIVTQSSYAGPLSDEAMKTSRVVEEAVRSIKRYRHLPTFDFGGIGLSPKNLGVNIFVSKLAESGVNVGADLGSISTSSNNLILFNPYTILEEVVEELGEVSARRAAEQTWETFVHEVTHQLARGHEEDFSSVFTRLLHAIAPTMEGEVRRLTSLWDFALRNGVSQDMVEIRRIWRINDEENFFRKYSGHELEPNITNR